MKRVASLFLTACALVVSLPALAWHDAGHKVVAAIAYYDMGATRAKKVADILRHHPDYALWMREKPKEVPEDVYLFMRAAVWPDDIRNQNHPSNSEHRGTWHYVAAWVPLPSNTLTPPLEPGEHIQQAVAKCRETVRGNAPARDKAIAICWLFHLIGDIQMPLHAGSLVTPVFIEGDQGGNRFYVKVEGRAIRLHTLWDGLLNRDAAKAGSETKRFDGTGPSDVDQVKVLKIAKSLQDKLPRGVLPELNAKTFEDNVVESRKAGFEYAYLEGRLMGTKTENAAYDVPPSYIKASHAIAERRVTLGGYRLANELKSDGF